MTVPTRLMLVALLAACNLVGCERSGGADGASRAESRAGPIRITTTTGMITDIVQQVVGDRAQVTGIMKQGVDPHLYKPTRSDVIQLMDADIVFYNGLMLEGKMADVLVKVARSGKPVHAVTEMLDDTYVLNDPRKHHDPHVWMDVKGWIHAVRVVAEALSEYDPESAEAYREHAEAYIRQLESLDRYAAETIGSIPRSRRVLVTAHDAFNYIGRAYDIEVRGIQGISTESEAGVKDINDLIDLLVNRQIGAVFVETSVADKNVRALVEGARARNHPVQIGGALFSDAMGAAGTYEGTYIGMIDHNVTTITRALGGTAPEGGFRSWSPQPRENS